MICLKDKWGCISDPFSFCMICLKKIHGDVFWTHCSWV